ncbi:OsmC family protein [Desulfosporosinus sp. OT]|uniref:OsmC family protein n=1 Tax=Desulfosporosinus sp. OT TaxID=913865 RepID=UPI0002239C87|nr:OsmC family protein [Desulfosporosinus sp. OT]EGW40879.1 osmC-like family protein [Desulfosporosinus sp. OT]
MGNQLEVSVGLTNQKVQFTGVARANLAIIIDCLPPLGDGQGYTPLELLLISLASCSGTTVLTLLRKMRKNISGLKVNAKGIRREQPPTSFQKITLEFVISSEDVQSSEAEKAIKLTEETYCPVWTMLKNNVEVIPEFRIVTQ